MVQKFLLIGFVALITIFASWQFIPTKKIRMTITSSAFGNNDSIPKEYTCDGDGSSPPLAFTGIPAQTKSLALAVEDPDAPAATWIHWLVWNMSPQTRSIDTKSVPPEATEGTTSFGKPGYGGPCPPSGTHHYIFTLYALDTTLSIGSSAKFADLRATIKDHILAQAQLIGLYARK